MVKLSDIQININTDFSYILNEYASLLENATDKEAVLNQNFIEEQVEHLIELIASRDIKRLPYDSITAKVIAFNEKADDEQLSESFDYLMNEITEVLKVIIDNFENKGIFAGEKIPNNSEKKKYSKSIIAFYKLLEHTKLASLQYKDLYQKTKKEVNAIQFNINEINDEAEKASATLRDIKKVKTSIYTDFIAILGVFSAFVLVVFSSFFGLVKILEGLQTNEISILRTLIISTIMMSFLITILYSLLYWVSLIIEKPILKNCTKCEDKCLSPIHICQRHGFYLLIIFICALVFCVSIYLLKK